MAVRREPTYTYEGVTPRGGWGRRRRRHILVVAACCAVLLSSPALAQPPMFQDLFNGKDLTGWVNINTAPDTWTVRDGLLVNTGKPIGVMCSEKMYENFLLHIEWMHLEPGGNSGVCAWSDANPRPDER